MQLTGIFEVLRVISDSAVQGRPGDRIVVRPWDPERYCSLVRRLPSSAVRFAMDPYLARLIATTPPTSHLDAAVRHLRAQTRHLHHRPDLRLLK